jgi:hypothetical protein
MENIVISMKAEPIPEMCVVDNVSVVSRKASENFRYKIIQVCHWYRQVLCCGAGQFLCSSGSRLSKILAPVPASTIFPVYFRSTIFIHINNHQKGSNFLYEIPVLRSFYAFYEFT